MYLYMHYTQVHTLCLLLVVNRQGMTMRTEPTPNLPYHTLNSKAYVVKHTRTADTTHQLRLD